MAKSSPLVLMMVLLVAATGCGVKKYVGLDDDDQAAYGGPVYPPNSQIAIAFQPSQLGKSCRVFAEALVELPANVTGKDVQNIILGEAGARGADHALIGQTRQNKKNDGLRFFYYGPDREYLCAEQCGGWKYGYSRWEKQGAWVSLGLSEWGNANARFDVPLITQVALLRCQ